MNKIEILLAAKKLAQQIDNLSGEDVYRLTVLTRDLARLIVALIELEVKA
jgi:hypothetical protein